MASALLLKPIITGTLSLIFACADVVNMTEKLTTSMSESMTVL